MAARSSLTPPSPAWPKSVTAADRRPSSWTSPQRALPKSPAPNSPRTTCANLDRSGTGTRSAKSTSPSQGPYPGPTPPLPPHPPCTWAEQGRRCPGPRPKSPLEDIPGSHLSLPANHRPWTAPEPPQETTFCGPTPTSLQAPPWTRQKRSPVESNNSRRASGTSSWQHTPSQPTNTANTTRTTSEATSPQGHSQPANCSNDRSSHPTLGGHQQKVSIYVHPPPHRGPQCMACAAGTPPNPRLKENLDCPHQNSATGRYRRGTTRLVTGEGSARRSWTGHQRPQLISGAFS